MSRFMTTGASALARRAVAPTKSPVVKFPVNYLDLAPHWQVFRSIFYWMDCAQAEFWRSRSIPEEFRDDFSSMFNDACVMRCNTCEVYDLSRLGALRPEIEVRPWISRVGNTSWVMSFELLESREQGNAVVAHASTVMVSVDPETHSHSRPIPHREVISKMLETQQPTSVDLSHISRSSEGAEVGESHTSSFQARLVDCDHFFHINNAAFPKLAEEARAIAVSEGAFGKEAAELAASPATTCHVDYIQQVYPLATMTATTSLLEPPKLDGDKVELSRQNRTFKVDISSEEGELCSTVLLGVPQEANPSLPTRIAAAL